MKWINPDYLAGRLQGRSYRGDFFDSGGSEMKTNPEVQRLANLGTFRPFSLTTSAGRGFSGIDQNTGQATFGAQLSRPYADLQASALGGTQQLLPQLQQALGRQPSQFQFGGGDINQVTSDIFNQQAALLQPQFQQQGAALQEQLFGSGRLGLRLSGDAIGAGTGAGMIQPDAFGLGRAQQQTLAQLGVQSRLQALGEQQQRFGIESGQFGLNEQARQQQVQNLLGGTGQLFGIGAGISDIENQLLQLGLTGEQIRSGSYLDAAGSVAGGTMMEESGPGLGFSAIVGAVGGASQGYGYAKGSG